MTPGSALRRSSAVSANALTWPSVRYEATGSETVPSSTPSVRKPLSTASRCPKLRTISVAPVTSIIANATSMTTNERLSQVRPGPVDVRVSSRNDGASRTIVARIAGNAPSRDAASKDAPAANSQTRQSIEIVASRGRSMPSSFFSHDTATAASSMPMHPPATASSPFSMAVRRTSLQRPDPSAARIAESRARPPLAPAQDSRHWRRRLAAETP